MYVVNFVNYFSLRYPIISHLMNKMFVLNRFYMAACLGEQKFKSVTGKNLHETKNRATAEALRHLKKMGKYDLKSSQVITFNFVNIP